VTRRVVYETSLSLALAPQYEVEWEARVTATYQPGTGPVWPRGEPQPIAPGDPEGVEDVQIWIWQGAWVRLPEPMQSALANDHDLHGELIRQAREDDAAERAEAAEARAA